jgi:hypothetical protein
MYTELYITILKSENKAHVFTSLSPGAISGDFMAKMTKYKADIFLFMQDHSWTQQISRHYVYMIVSYFK